MKQLIFLSDRGEFHTPYYKTLFKVSPNLKLMLSLLFAKRVTVTASILNTNSRPRFIVSGIVIVGNNGVNLCIFHKIIVHI
jgi:hypothetical protein